MSIDHTGAAVVLIEYRNDFATDGGALHGAVEQVMGDTGMLAATSPEEHENAIRFDFPMFSPPMSGEELASSLAGGRQTADASRGY